MHNLASVSRLRSLNCIPVHKRAHTHPQVPFRVEVRQDWRMRNLGWHLKTRNKQKLILDLRVSDMTSYSFHLLVKWIKSWCLIKEDFYLFLSSNARIHTQQIKQMKQEHFVLLESKFTFGCKKKIKTNSTTMCIVSAHFPPQPCHDKLTKLIQQQWCTFYKDLPIYYFWDSFGVHQESGVRTVLPPFSW